MMRAPGNSGASASGQSKKAGLALVGLGHYSETQLGPALRQTQYCYLAGIVTGTPSKAEAWKKAYGIPDANVYDYTNFDAIADNPEIGIVYIVLPNALHAEYTVRAARAGKHVIVEKPMAVSVEECDQMIAACREAGVMLSVGYRLHFEPHNREMMRLGQENVLGPVRRMDACFGLARVSGWRLSRELAGGGSLVDVGIYCIQGVRYTTGLEPFAVTAEWGKPSDPDKFREVEDEIRWTMELPGGIVATCRSVYSEEVNYLHAEAEKGWFRLEPAYLYKGQQGTRSGGTLRFPEVNQQAKQMDDFAEAVLNNRPTRVPGEMGRQDIRIIAAIYEALRTGQRVEIK